MNNSQGFRVGDPIPIEQLPRKFVAAGGASLVFLVTPPSGACFIQKVSKKESNAHLVREARAFERAGVVQGLVKYLGFDVRNGLFLKFLEGETLATKLTWQGRLSDQHAVSLVRSLCKTVHVLHQRGVIHRDLAPNNILITNDGNVWVIDLGLALVAAEGGGYEEFELGRVGTGIYKDPEINDFFPGDAQSDVYSIGQLLATMTLPPSEAKLQQINKK